MDNEKNVTTEKLDSEQRVRVLSPGMLVAKRFFRNKLAIVGLVIIVSMFLFAFLGGAIMPYSQSQVFYTKEVMQKDYAGATYIEDYQIKAAEGVELPGDIFSKTILAITTKEYVFESKEGGIYGLGSISDNSFFVYSLEKANNLVALSSPEKNAAAEAGRNIFDYNGETYLFSGEGKVADLYNTTEIGVACQLSFTAFGEGTELSYDFYHNVLVAMKDGATTMIADGVNYQIETDGATSALVKTESGEDFASVSNMNINSVVGGVYLTPDYKEAAKEAIDSGAESFTYTNADGEETEYIISNKNGEYIIKRYQETQVVDTYASPSKAHLLGTDANGMDLLARLMYGGRISL